MTDEPKDLLAQIINELQSIRVVIERQEGLRGKYDRPLTREEAAEYLRIHPDTLYRWAVEEGRIAYSRLGDGGRAALRFERRDLDDFLHRQRIATVEQTKARL